MAYFNLASLGVLAVLASLTLAGCDEPATSLVAGDPASLDGGAAGAGGSCNAGTSQPCECTGDTGANLVGSRGCYGGRWGECVCSGNTPPPVVVEGECKAGRYEGDFSGIYTSGFTFVGVPIPVFGLDATGPGLAFTLNRNVQAAGQEFDIYTISDGYVKGTADGLFPFEGVLTGELDCATKTFTGTLRGGYCVTLCAGVNEAEFEGPITGVYDSDGLQFTSGSWDLLEVDGNSGLFGDYGGMGEWNAVWVGEGSVDTTTGEAIADGDTP